MKDRFDYILIDYPPSLDSTLNSFTASNELFSITTQCESFALKEVRTTNINK
ncbi:MAG: ParA family protein [Clostridia bacterium]